MLSLKRLVTPAASLILCLCFAAGYADDAAQATSPIHHKVLPILKTAKLIGPTDPKTVLHLAVGLYVPHAKELQQFADAVSDPRSPVYRHFIKPEEVGARFGAPKADVDAVVAFLKQNGMKIKLIAKSHFAVLADATVAQAKSAFQNGISDFEGPNPVGPGKVKFYANTTPAMVPASLSNIIFEVSGLETYTRAKPSAQTNQLTPNLMAKLYQTEPIHGTWPGYWGKGRTIGITCVDGYWLDPDVGYFLTTFNLPIPDGGPLANIYERIIDGGAGDPTGEGDLDIQMVLANAPLANIIIYSAPKQNLLDQLTTEANDNFCDIITESYLTPCDHDTAQSCFWAILGMTAQGITYMNATGDFGTAPEHCQYPDDDPNVLQVGGTCATVDDVTGQRISEVAWSGSGGGWSTRDDDFNTQPYWQRGNGVPNINVRLFPDVALHASGLPDGCGGAWPFYLRGALTAECGTSGAAPMFAGCLAVVEERLIASGQVPANGRFGNLQYVIYQQNGRPDVWHDITEGPSNGLLPNGTQSVCTPAWDTVTGWGAIDFNAFMNSQLIQTTTSPYVKPTPVYYGEKVKLGADINPSFVGGTVTFTDGLLFGKMLGIVWAGDELETKFDAVGTHYIVAEYSGDISHAPSTGVMALDVKQAPTTVSVAAFPNPTAVGYWFQIIPTVDPTPDGGTINIVCEGVTLGTVDIGYSMSWRFMTAGTHRVYAFYTGDANYLPNAMYVDVVVVPAPTDMTLTAHPNPGMVGQKVTLAPTVTPTPDAGNIVISDNFVAIGTVNVGKSLDWTFTTPGVHSLLAEYHATANYGASRATLDLVVQSPTTITLSADPNPGVYQQHVRITPTITPTPDGGTVDIIDDGVKIGTIPANQPFDWVFTVVKTHHIVANYNGDTVYLASSGSMDLDINKAPTTTTLAANPDPGTVGQKVTLTPTVAPGAASGTVVIKDGSKLLGTVNIGQSLDYTFMTAKTHHLSAEYSGDDKYLASTGTLDLVVNPAPTTTTVVAGPSPGLVRQAITIKPTVTPPPDGGTIAVEDDGNPIGTVPLGGSLTWKFSTANNHVITAEYSGDNNYLPSTGSTTVEIDKAPTTTTLTANPPIGGTGDPTALHAVVICTVDNNPPDAPGTVDFWQTNPLAFDLGTQPLGTDLTYTPWFAGKYALEARYSGNDNFLPSTGGIDFKIVAHHLPSLTWNTWKGPTPTQTVFRPIVITVDDITLREILTDNSVTIDKNLVIQAVRLQKVTPSLKCTAFVSGPGSGFNTNFDTGLQKATDSDLDKDLANLALHIPQGQVALGERALLFSPPGTAYTLSVVYVVIDAHGRPSVPHTVTRAVEVMVPSRDDMRKVIEYFSTVAAGATQKPKIPADVVDALDKALDVQDNLAALIAFETVLGETSTDFSTLVNAPDPRFATGYLIDSDEEPIGCLLVEQANALLWH